MSFQSVAFSERNDIFKQYIEAGLYLIPIPRGQKGPITTGWNLPKAGYKDLSQLGALNGCNVGLHHLDSHTCALDIDDLKRCKRVFEEHGLNLDELASADDAVQIISGKENRLKLLYRLPEDCAPLPTKQYGDKGMVLELRCAHSGGETSAQDVLPPSIHPETKKPYCWGGKGHFSKLPTLPDALRKVWDNWNTIRPNDSGPAPEHTNDAQKKEQFAYADDVIKSALAAIDPDCAYHPWIDIGMGIWSHDPGERGFSLWHDWSAKGIEEYKGEKHCREKWGSFKEKAKGITLGTLYHIAKENGWEPPAYEDPQPLRRPLSPAEPFPMDALGPLLGSAAKAIQEIIQAPGAICGQSVLAAAALAVQGRANVELDGREILLSLYCATIGASGERKSAVDAVVLGPHRAREKVLAEKYKEDVLDHGIKQELYVLQRKRIAQAKEGSIEDKDAAMQELGAPPQPPLAPMLLVSEPTYEGLVKLLKRGQPSLGLFTDEGGRFVGGYAMNSDNALKTASGLSELFDRGSTNRVRAGDDETANIYGRRFSVHLMMQPTVAEQLLGNDELRGQGVLSRFLISWPESTVGRRPYCEKNILEDPAIVAYSAKMAEFLRAEHSLRDGTQNELVPRALTLTPKSKQLWVIFHDWADKEAGAGGELEPIRGLANKIPDLALRLAGVLALVADPDAELIEQESIENGIKLSNFYLREAIRIVETGITAPDIRLAEQVLDWLRGKNADNKPYEFVHSRKIQRFGPNAVRTSDDVGRAMRILVKHGWARPFKPNEKVIEGRRRRCAWKIILPEGDQRDG